MRSSGLARVQQQWEQPPHHGAARLPAPCSACRRFAQACLFASVLHDASSCKFYALALLIAKQNH